MSSSRSAVASPVNGFLRDAWGSGYMKVPQRNFVVEFKSGRRQPKAKTNSIWGDTDLKALARAVEEEASHLFNSTEVPVTPDAGGDMVSRQVNAGAQSEHAGDVDVAPEALPSAVAAGTEVQKQHEAERLPDEAVALVEETQPVSGPQLTSRAASRKRANHAHTRAIASSSKRHREDQNGLSATADDLISLDEVAALDAENKRLKRLLAEQLYAQNLQLKRMLERFDLT